MAGDVAAGAGRRRGLGAVTDLSKPGKTSLSERMRLLATQRDDLPANWLDTAQAFDDAATGFYASPPTVDVRKFMGCFARARRMWCDATGEPLV